MMALPFAEYFRQQCATQQTSQISLHVQKIYRDFTAGYCADFVGFYNTGSRYFFFATNTLNTINVEPRDRSATLVTMKKCKRTDRPEGKM